MRNRLKLTLICFCLLAVASFAVHPARRASARQAGARKIDFVRDIQPIFQARCAQCHGGEKHWAFVAPVRPPTPEVKNKAWARNPIDAFILARLERENLAPSPEADKITLLRRLSLDLIGLPPTPEEVDAFLKDTSSRAYEKQVERLLASPHYGERWGRLWLDADAFNHAPAQLLMNTGRSIRPDRRSISCSARRETRKRPNDSSAKCTPSMSLLIFCNTTRGSG